MPSESEEVNVNTDDSPVEEIIAAKVGSDTIATQVDTESTRPEVNPEIEKILELVQSLQKTSDQIQTTVDDIEKAIEVGSITPEIAQHLMETAQEQINNILTKSLSGLKSTEEETAEPEQKTEKIPRHEVLKKGDKILVQLRYFENQRQTDEDLCGYLAAAAQVTFAEGQDEKSLKVSQMTGREINGLKNLAEVIRRQIGTPRLSLTQIRKELDVRASNAEKEDKNKLYRLNYRKEQIGDHILDLLKLDYLTAVALGAQEHAVVVIGQSEDGQELIVWDAYFGEGNPRLKRISKNRKDMIIMSSLKIDQVFKPEDPVYREEDEGEPDLSNHIKFGE